MALSKAQAAKRRAALLIELHRLDRIDPLLKRLDRIDPLLKVSAAKKSAAKKA